MPAVAGRHPHRPRFSAAGARPPPRSPILAPVLHPARASQRRPFTLPTSKPPACPSPPGGHSACAPPRDRQWLVLTPSVPSIPGGPPWPAPTPSALPLLGAAPSPREALLRPRRCSPNNPYFIKVWLQCGLPTTKVFPTAAKKTGIE
uniref:Uncharacterized protein n=1 Tax=Oryza meridionalis TaxID=40149 RepID=A0A0E0EAB5_9ORYZ